jgi:hypothetical protein
MSIIPHLPKLSLIRSFLLVLLLFLAPTRILLPRHLSEQLVRRANLDHLPLIHDKNSINVSDGIQAMSYRQDSVLGALTATVGEVH